MDKRQRRYVNRFRTSHHRHLSKRQFFPLIHRDVPVRWAYVPHRQGISHKIIRLVPHQRAEVTYGKGEVFWQNERTFTIHGEGGSLIFEGEKGQLINSEGSQVLEVETRRGLFAKDTAMVLDYLFDRSPLYVTPQASFYALEVAYAAYQSSLLGKTVFLADN